MASNAKKNTVSAQNADLPPLEAMKLCGSSTMLTLLPQLTNFLLPTRNKCFLGYAVTFYKLLKSNELRSNPTAVQTSANMDSCLNLLDSSK